jgi:hypothetical protein
MELTHVAQVKPPMSSSVEAKQSLSLEQDRILHHDSE